MIIVVGVDGPGSDRALAEAIRLGAALEAEVHACHVVHTPPIMVASLDAVPGGREAVAAAERRAVWDELEPVIAAAAAPVRRVDLSGYPADTIVEYATGVGAGLIVVGSRGRGDLASLVLGSTSHRIIHAAPCNVLIVKGESQ